MRSGYLVTVLALSVGLTLALLLSLPTARAAPLASARYVATTGHDQLWSDPFWYMNDCTNRALPCRTVQHTIAWASPGDVIYVAQGAYTGTGNAVITVTKSITLYGGWDGAASGPLARDPAAHPTVLDGEHARRVVYLGGDTSPTISGFIIANGWCSGTTNVGAGILVDGGTPIVAGNVITHNVARDYGGGIYVASGAAVISANDILSNRVTYGGGGVYLSYGVTTRLHANRIADNRANYGGGIEVDNTTLTATANLVLRNQASSAWLASGALARVRAVNNVVAQNSDEGVRISGCPADLIHSTIVSNTGAAVEGMFSAAITLTDNLIAYNAVGVQTSGGAQAVGSYNLFWQNGSDPFVGSNPVLADPRLAPDGYHLSADSAALDAGVNAGVASDVDGDRRPIGAGYDIGADERRLEAYLPLVRRTG